MASQARELNDQDLVYAYIAEYLDDQLPESEKKHIDNVLSNQGLQTLPTDFGIKRGQFQIASQKLYLNESKLHRIYTLVEDDAARANHEAHDIEDLGRSELMGNSLRLIILIALLAGLVGGAYLYFAPPRKAPFAPLETLMYESLVMMEEPEVRLDFPTESIDELRDYFVRYPDLGFKIRDFQSPGPIWKLIGGSVIDYEVARIAVAQFSHQSTQVPLFIYLYEGQISDLPNSKPGQQDGITFQAYSSDRFNVVAWQVAPDIMAMVMGYESTNELATLGKNAVGTY